MGLWTRLRDAYRDNQSERWSPPTGPEDLSGAQVFMSTYGDGMDREPVLPTMQSLARLGYGGSSVVFSLIATRMLLFAEAEPRWWDKERRRFDADTEGLDILLHPWPGASHSEMQARVELDVSLAGNAFIAAPDGEDRLARLRPDHVTIQRVVRKDRRGRPFSEVDGYWYGAPGSAADDWVFYDVDEVAHFAPYPDPLAEFRGMSWLTPVVREVSHDAAMVEYSTKYFDNAAPQPLDAKVLTPSGWSTMGRMRVGSEVIGSDGKPHRVVGVFPQGVRDIYRVTFSDGSSAESTDDHVWSVQSNYDVKQGVSRTLTLRQIMDGGLRYRSGPHKWSVPCVDPVQFDGDDELPLDPYLLGSLLGDGCFGGNGRGSGVVSMAFDSRDVDEQLALLRLPAGVVPHVRRREGRSCEATFTCPGQYRNPLLSTVKALGLYGVTGADKFVPHQFLTAGVEDRLALLQGLMDTDGGADRSGFRFTNNSRHLVDAVMFLTRSLGGVASLSGVRVRRGRPTFTVSVGRLADGMNPFRLSRKAGTYRMPAGRGRRRFIVGVEKVRSAEAQCIAVDVADHLYVTDDFVLTHNTPNMIVRYSQNLGPEKLARAQEAIRQRHGGLDNSYKAMVLDSGADVTIAGNTFEQMNFNSLRAATENRIASASGVPPMLVGFKEGLQASTLANYESATRRFADMTMRPLWRGLASELGRVVSPPRKVGRSRSSLVLRFDASDVPALQAGQHEKAETFHKQALTMGELIRTGFDPKTVADAVESQDPSMLKHTEKTPTALYEEDGSQANKKQGADGDGSDGGPPPADGGGKGGPRPGKQGEGAAAPQPRGGVSEEQVRLLLAEQREELLGALRAVLGEVSAAGDDAGGDVDGDDEAERSVSPDDVAAYEIGAAMLEWLHGR